MKERNVLISPVTVVICRFDSERESGGRWQEGGGCGERFKVKCKSFVPVLVAPVYKNNKFTGRCIYFLSMYQSFLDIVMIDTGRRWRLEITFHHQNSTKKYDFFVSVE